MPRFQKPKLPKATNVTKQRAAVEASLLDIKAAREKYKQELARAAVGLRGKAFLRFVYRGTQAMRRAGMYSPSYLDYDLLANTIKAIYRADMIGKQNFESWQWWKRDRGIGEMFFRQMLKIVQAA